MGQNDKDVCKSDRCCCQLISKCEEKPKPRNACGGREERTEMSICDFLKSQPIPEWIKVNTGRLQHGRNPCAEVNDSKDRQRGPCRQAPPASNYSSKNRTTYVHRPKPQPKWVRSSEQVCVPNNGGMHQSQHRHRNDQRTQPTIRETEDRQLSQIIINFGTVVTSEKCKPDDSGQQTNSEFQEIPLEKKRRTCKSTARPPPDRSTCCTRAQADRSISTGPSEPLSCTRAPSDRPITTCPPPDRSSCTRTQSDRSTSTFTPLDRSSFTRAPADRPIPTCPPPDRSSCTRTQSDRSTSTCSPPDRSTSAYPTSDRSSCTRAPVDRPIPTCPRPDRSNCTRAPANSSTYGSRTPADRSTSSYPLAGRPSLTLPQASSTFIRPSMDRPNFTYPQTDRKNHSISTRSPLDWSTSTRSLADRSNSVRPPNVRPPNVRPPNVRPYAMKSNTTAQGSHSRYQDNPSTQQRVNSESEMKSKTTSCYCDNENSNF